MPATTNSSVVSTIVLYFIVLYVLIYYCTLHLSYNCISLPLSLNSAAIFLRDKLVKSVLE
jgi:hypothetical protein